MKLLRDPLFRFFLLGGALFVASVLTADYLSPDPERRIAIDAAEVEVLATTWQRQWRRAPTEEELSKLVEARVREEILYREAVGMGLDRNDTVVRRRLVQKMELLFQDLALLADPTDDKLREFMDQRSEEYRQPPRISFTHVFFNADRRGPTTEADALRLLGELREANSSGEAAVELGDRLLLPDGYTLVTPIEVRRQFGTRFADALFELKEGWHGPLDSGYGLHLVHVEERVPGRLADYAEVRQRVLTDYNRDRTDRANDSLYEGLAEGYRIEIDEAAVRRAALPPRSTTSEP